jgi:predicted PurR-regulated permease PerM
MIRSTETTNPGIQEVQRYALPVIAAGVILAILYFGRVLFITTAVAVIIALILEPLVGLVMRLHLPRTVATFIVSLVGILALYFGSLAAWNPISNIAGDAPAFRRNLSELVNRISRKVQDVEDTATHFVVPETKPAAPAAPAPSVRQRNRRTAEPPPAAAPNPADLIQEVRIHDDRSPVAGFVYARLGSVYEFVLMASFVPFLVFFMLSWRDHIYRSFLRFFEGADRIAAARSLEGVAEMARAFVVGNFLIGLLLAFLSWSAFALIHLPYAALAGALSGFLSLMPYIGMPAALAPPVLAILATGAPTSTLLFVFLIVLGLHLTAMNVFYPKLVGARVHLNPLVVTFSLMFWGFLWDAPGLLLAIPITAGIKAVCDSVASLRPYGRFLGD